MWEPLSSAATWLLRLPPSPESGSCIFIVHSAAEQDEQERLSYANFFNLEELQK